MSREQDQLRNLALDADQQRAEPGREAIPDERDELQDEEREAQLFGEVAETILGIFDQTPEFRPPPDLPRELEDALELLWEAKVAEREDIGDGHISAVDRMRELNLALAALRPVLSVGLAPGAREMGESYQVIQEQVAELRAELLQTIHKEAVGRRKRKPVLEEEEGGEDQPGEDEPGDAEPGEDEPEEAGAEAADEEEGE